MQVLQLFNLNINMQMRRNALVNAFVFLITSHLSKAIRPSKTNENIKPWARTGEIDHQARSASPPIYNERPIIGVLTLPGGEVSERDSYISAGYVKWLEAAGARVIPILYDWSDAEITRVFRMVNGIFFTGGNYPLRDSTQWYHAGELLFNLAKEENENGVIFPIHGHCLGLQLLLTLISHDEYCLSEVDAHNHSSAITFTKAGRTSALIKGIPEGIRSNMERFPISLHNHGYGLLPEALTRCPSIDGFFNVVAINKDRQGREYASIVEGKRYPFTGLAFHPEKIAYEWTTEIQIPKSKMAIDAAYAMAQAFVERTRLNNHAGKDIVEEDKYLIYNYRAEFFGRHEQVDDPAFFEQSGFGKQVPSTASTVPAFGFGTSGKDSYQKLYLSPEQTKTMSGNNSMGAVYKCYDSIGPQPDSKFPSAPAAGFGTSTRSIKYGGVTPGPGKYETKGAIGNQADSKKENQARTVFGTSTRDQTVKLGCEEELLKTIAYGRASPGPCTYSATSGHGKQVDGTKASSPAFKMGSSSRFADKNPMNDVPGVGSYASAVPAYGKQVLSSKSTLPTLKMGTSTRDQALKVFISKEHGKATFGLNSPGPATGPRPNSFGVQTLSQKKTNPTWGFGTSKRAPTYDNGVPGPGNYYA